MKRLIVIISMIAVFALIISGCADVGKKPAENGSTPEGTADFYFRNDISISVDFYRPDVVFQSRYYPNKVTADVFYENNRMRLDNPFVKNDKNEKISIIDALRDDDKAAVIMDGPLFDGPDENNNFHFKREVSDYLTKTLGFEIIDPETYRASGQFKEYEGAYYRPLVIGKWADIRNMINSQNAFLEGCGYTEEVLVLGNSVKASLIVSIAAQYKQ